MTWGSEPTDRDPLVLPDGVLRCPSCTWGPPDRTYGCDECNETGRARTWKLEGRLVGGHWHVTVRCGRPGARAKLGDIVMDLHDWRDLWGQLDGNRLWTMTEQGLLDDDKIEATCGWCSQTEMVDRDEVRGGWWFCSAKCYGFSNAR